MKLIKQLLQVQVEAVLARMIDSLVNEKHSCQS